eukprot:7946094-Ditylum_brightwellii.AAC.1
MEDVELLGAKGNAALVTFANASSCLPCVEEYLDSDAMRAMFVGARKKDELCKTFCKSDEGDREMMDIMNVNSCCMAKQFLVPYKV